MQSQNQSKRRDIKFCLITVENNKPPPDQNKPNTLSYTHMPQPNVYTYLEVVMVTAHASLDHKKNIYHH